MKLIIFSLMIMTISANSFAESPSIDKGAERKPASNLANVEVFTVNKSSFDLAEKWIDNNLGVVCYAVGLDGRAISCLKFR